MNVEELDAAALESLNLPVSPNQGDQNVLIGWLLWSVGDGLQTVATQAFAADRERKIRAAHANGDLNDDQGAVELGEQRPLTFGAFVDIARKGAGLRAQFESDRANYYAAIHQCRRTTTDPTVLLSGSITSALGAVVRARQSQTALLERAEGFQRAMHAMIREYGLSGMHLIASFEAGFTPDANGYAAYLQRLYPEFVQLLERFAPLMMIPEADRRQHTYVTGGSGSGKSETLKALVYGTLKFIPEASQVIIDPHGDLAEQIARWQEFRVSDRLVYIAPNLFDDAVPTINPFDVGALGPREKDLVAQEIVEAMEQLLQGEAGGNLSVNMRALLMPCVLTLLERPGSTFTDLGRSMEDGLNAELVALGRQHPREPVRNFFLHNGTGFGSRHYDRTKASIATKLQSLRNTFSFDALVNGPSSFDLEAAVNAGKVIVFNLAKGEIGRDASEAVGRFVLAKLQGMALRRQRVPAGQRRPVHVYVDECQNYISPATIAIMEETRKYGLYLTLAQQVAGRGMSTEMLKVVLNNTNVKLAGRTKDDRTMASLMGVDMPRLQRLRPGQFLVQTGSRPTLEVQVHDEVLGDSNAMTDTDWGLRTLLMREHYRPLGVAAEDEPAAAPRPRKKRQLV